MNYDVVIIGGGHAGTEAAWAAAGALAGNGRVALITMDPSRIGQMSCNPAIGGLAKGQIVREVDALGGLMGRAIDATGIMFKMLNTSKGAAVRGPRAQADKYAYASEIQRLLCERQIDVIAGTVDEVIVDGGRVIGVHLPAGSGLVGASAERCAEHESGETQSPPIFDATPIDPCREPIEVRADAVVLTTGTFMRGLMHTGDEQTDGGRGGEGAALGLSGHLRDLGFELGRLKTGTPPRLRRGTIDWDDLEIQTGDEQPVPFSDLSPEILHGGRFPRLPQAECRLTQTTARTHDLIRENLHRAPMYSGQIEAETGPRYCPSIEDKVIRFADRSSHHVFLEPESLFTDEIYCNGISTSLPRDVQEQMIHAMPGCSRAEIIRWGYAVEYDVVWPHQINATGMTKSIRGLFLAGQINGTTGYEEAAGQGLVAGLNAARLVRGESEVKLGRDEAFIGVMMDDLVTKVPREPYRMFTSRAEHRLMLRADNADSRLTRLGRELGLVDDRRWDAWETRRRTLESIQQEFERSMPGGKTLAHYARRPDVGVDAVRERLAGTYDRHLIERVMVESRYAGYIQRQRAEIKRQRQADHQAIPDWIRYESIDGLRAEAAETLARFRPSTLGQAARLAGVNPADVTLLAVAIRRGRSSRP